MRNLLQVSERNVKDRESLVKMKKEGYFPAIVYGKGKTNKAVFVEELEFTKKMREVGRNGILELQIGAEKEKVMLQEIQREPLRGKITHADFFIIDLKTEVDVEVNVHLVGEAIGVKNGGILQQPLHLIAIRSLPNNIPEAIEIDVSSMEVGDTILVKDIKKTGNYEILADEETVIASILPPATEAVVESGETQDGQDVVEAKEEKEAVKD